MSDSFSDGRFWSARLGAQGQVEFYRGDNPTPGAAALHDMPLRYLALADGCVVLRSEAERNSIDDALEAQAQAAAEARAAQEAEWQAAAEVALAEAQAAEKAEQADFTAAPARDQAIAESLLKQINELRDRHTKLVDAIKSAKDIPDLQARTAEMAKLNAVDVATIVADVAACVTAKPVSEVKP